MLGTDLFENMYNETGIENFYIKTGEPKLVEGSFSHKPTVLPDDDGDAKK